MKELTQKINHTAVPSVTTNVQHQAFWSDTKEPTLVISHSAAKSVNINANNQVHWIHTKESTPMRNHLAFIFSKCDKVIVSQVAKMAFTNMLGGSQEPTIYSSKELCSDQNLTSDFSGLLKNPLMKAEFYQVPIFILQYTFKFSLLPSSNKLLVTTIRLA